MVVIFWWINNYIKIVGSIEKNLNYYENLFLDVIIVEDIVYLIG